MAMIYNTLNKMDDAKKKMILDDSKHFLTRMDAGEKV
jgi:hypothetical protein